MVSKKIILIALSVFLCTNSYLKTYKINPILQDLQPQLLWHYFDQISSIPRPSGHEQAIADYILSIAASSGLQGFKDSVGNVVIKKTASINAFAHVPTIVLQAHLDMVAEKKPDVQHDFFKDPIQLRRSENLIHAAGTTLGADNGIAVAAMLTLMTLSDLAHGPLEFLFTVEEEAGFGGAAAITPNTISGRILLNLDAENHGKIVIGCAGGCIVEGEMPIEYVSIPAPMEFFDGGHYRYYQISITGCQGGHSGADINHGRAHAIKILAQFLELLEPHQGLVASIKGGNKHNAIPRDAYAVIALRDPRDIKFNFAFEELKNKIKALYPEETEMNIEFSLTERQPVMAMNFQKQLVKLLTTLPQGVITMSADIDGLVQTSTNLASIESTPSTIKIVTSQRSLFDHEKEQIVQRISNHLQQAGATPRMRSSYPGWRPHPTSQIVKLVKKTFEKLFEQKPMIKAIHAGLECGKIGQAIPDIEMVAFGPTIKNAHSPTEYVDVITVEGFWKLLITCLHDFALQETHCISVDTQ